MHHSFGPLVRAFFDQHPSWRPEIHSDCPPGWDSLVASTLEALYDISEQAQQPVRIAQLKEKWAALRIYLAVPGHPGPTSISIVGDEGVQTFRTTVAGEPSAVRAMRKIVDDATVRSRSMCQVCGNPGVQRAGGWLRVLCDEHGEGKP